jgi:hypothetical protein
MPKISKRIAAIGLGVAFAIGASLTASAQAPVPVRKPPPPAPIASGTSEPTPTPAIKKTLICSRAGISQNLFDTSGLRCPDPGGSGKCYYVIATLWYPVGADHDSYYYNPSDFVCTSRGSDVNGTYQGISADPAGNVTYRTSDSTQVCVVKFPNLAGMVPRENELVVKGPLPCL